MIPPERDTLPPRAESHIPGPGRLPTGTNLTDRVDPLTDLAERVGDISDALHHPDGLVHRLFKELAKRGAENERRASKRHTEVVRLLTDLANAVAGLDHSVTMTRARLTLVEGRSGAAE